MQTNPFVDLCIIDSTMGPPSINMISREGKRGERDMAHNNDKERGVWGRGCVRKQEWNEGV